MSDATIRVAVTGMGSPLGQNIYKALRLSSLPLDLYLLDAYPFSVGLLFEGRPFVCGLASAESYIDQLARFLARERIQMIFFGTEVEPRAIAPHLERLRRDTPTAFALNAPEALAIADDKLLTARHLRQRGIDSPLSADAADPEAVDRLVAQVGFPLVVKPRRGSAARGLGVAHEAVALRSMLRAGAVVQECLLPEDQEYTVGVYRCRDGTIAAVTTIQRTLEFGLTYKGILTTNPAIESYAVRVAETLDVYASVNVQLRLTQRGPVAFEVNPRFSSTTPVRAHFGVNETELAIREYVLGERIERRTARAGAVLRYWSERYLEAGELRQLRSGRFEPWDRIP